MKKIIALLLSTIMIASFVACSSNSEQDSQPAVNSEETVADTSSEIIEPDITENSNTSEEPDASGRSIRDITDSLLSEVPHNLAEKLIYKNDKLEAVYVDSIDGVDFTICCFTKRGKGGPLYIIKSSDSTFTFYVAEMIALLNNGGYFSKALAITDDGFCYINLVDIELYDLDGERLDLNTKNWKSEMFDKAVDSEISENALLLAMTLAELYEADYGMRNDDDTVIYTGEKIQECFDKGLKTFF